ncbi:MAG: bifunctional folylpolyglutamate synthase/dihydrofolate synthase [Candidatus Omnitrophica bacterium]|nr:bifunctional folylpolyglutamate synthase/dihydrofolate synthase [Candidatus Omnitrophota bacterium]MDD5652575.1 bifunctional folylpolyglutamate synthase/dihydrofolate synthase [Candidatus Omnitrophota bacterium]
MTYLQVIKYLESFINYEKAVAYPYKVSLKLERVMDFLKAVGNPQDRLRCIHVAGSKGKGSTCAFITYILREAGYRVGLYTSPHLSDFRERIRVLKPRGTYSPKKEFEGMISRESLQGLVERLKPAIEAYNHKSKYGPLSFFEVYTALAFIYFLDKHVDYAVLETGLGGRLDATNVAHPLVCAITPISYEHTQKLGNTLGEIAGEKSGIIKGHGQIVISAPQEEAAMRVIKAKCKATNAKIYTVGKEIKYLPQKEYFSVKGRLDNYLGLSTDLIGRHQLINAAVAIGLAEGLKAKGATITSEAIKKGIAATVWPGRCEIVKRKPFVVLDGAQNVASAATLKKAIRENFQYRKLVLVLGISSDKDIKGICAQLSSLADRVILTRANSPRAVAPHILAGFFQDKENYLAAEVSAAKKLSFSLAAKGDLILVTGSLFVVGEFKDVQK